jgi:hypothetical protein
MKNYKVRMKRTLVFFESIYIEAHSKEDAAHEAYPEALSRNPDINYPTNHYLEVVDVQCLDNE